MTLYEIILNFYNLSRYNDDYMKYLNDNFKDITKYTIDELYDKKTLKYNEKESFRSYLQLNIDRYVLDLLNDIRRLNKKEFNDYYLNNIKTLILCLYDLWNSNSYCDIYNLMFKYYKDYNNKHKKPSNEFIELFIKEKYGGVWKSKIDLETIKSKIQNREFPYLDDLVEFYCYELYITPSIKSEKEEDFEISIYDILKETIIFKGYYNDWKTMIKKSYPLIVDYITILRNSTKNLVIKKLNDNSLVIIKRL